MQKPDGNPLPDIDDAQDGGMSSYSAPSAAASLSSAVGDNAPKCAAAAFVLLSFLAFGPRGLALALIVLAALRLTLGPVAGTASSGSRSGTGACPPPIATISHCSSCTSLDQVAAVQRAAATFDRSAICPRAIRAADEDREMRALR